MTRARALILDWAGQGRIVPGALRRSLELASALPNGAQWRAFLDRLMLFMGATMLVASLVFFFAYNWQDLGRFAKFALVEAPIAAAILLLWRLGLERLSGEAALLVAALLVGALLALVGQVYQTGADTFELFAAWAALILPWVLIGRSAALWIVWLALLNFACVFYFQVLPGMLGVVFAPERQLWLVFAVDTAALAAWELARAGGMAWLRSRWSARVVATASGSLATALAVVGIFERHGWNAVAWLAWLGAAYVVYRHAVRDVYVLAGAALSTIVVTAVFLGDRMPMRDAGQFLMIGMVVIGMSAMAGYWLRRVAAQDLP